jgi:hypothetical protein
VEVYPPTTDGSIWSKIGDGLSKLGTGLAHLAEDALPYVKRAVTAFANTILAPISTSNFNTNDDFSLSYSSPSIRSIRSLLLASFLVK